MKIYECNISIIKLSYIILKNSYITNQVGNIYLSISNR